MRLLKRLILGCGLLTVAAFADFKFANLAHQKLMQSSADFDNRILEVDLDWNGPPRQGCIVRRAYFANAYQTCFVAWYGQPGEGIQGFTYVYHRPQPLLLFYGQSPSSRYFQYSEYGIQLKQIRRDGFVNHLW